MWKLWSGFSRREISLFEMFSRDNMSAIKLEETGVLHSFSVVYRSFPGIDVPYVSAIVDLDGGGTVKGNLINIEPDPKK